MPYFNFENGVTPMNDTNLNQMQANIKNQIDAVEGHAYDIHNQVNNLKTKVDSIFKFKKYEKEITMNATSSKAVTMGSFSVPEGYTYVGCIANENGYGDQFLVTYSKYGENITAMVHNQFASNLTKTLKCIVIYVKEDYYNANLIRGCNK